jgi:glycosyltransferase involved in cell wall biosynthesis
MRKPRLLIFSSLFPDATRPGNGIFTENRIRSLVAAEEIAVRVVCPVPWFPLTASWAGNYSRYARVASYETRHGLDVRYPRYPMIPKIGMSLTPWLMAQFLVGPLRRLIAEGFDFDVLDAYYFYPDGVAAAMLARSLNKPLIITAYGTDINLIPRWPLPRRQIVWAARRADAMTAVCQSLKDAMIDIGVNGDRIGVVIHGVDLTVFHPPEDLATLRERLGMRRRTLLSVGYLIERKGHHIAIPALAELPDVELWIIGQGDQTWLRRIAEARGVADRVRFIGYVGQEKLADYYGAADALVLASSREGMANVMLESIACGTPIVATNVWGAPEVITTPAAGRLVAARTSEAIAAGCRALFVDCPDRAATRAHAEQFTWARTARDHLAIVHDVLAQRQPSRAPSESYTST